MKNLTTNESVAVYPKNIFILTDIEGISNILGIDEINRRNIENYYIARKKLMLDVNTAARACFDAGVEKVTVLDGHGGGGNFIVEELDARARLVGVSELHEVMRDADGVVMIGMHAMAGTADGFLHHTQSSVRISNYYYGEKKIGEMMQMAVFAGQFGVPCIAMSGDRAACREATEILPGIKTAEVKWANEREVAFGIPTDKAQAEIYRAVYEAVKDSCAYKPVSTALPLEITVEFKTPAAMAEFCQGRSDLQFIDDHTARSVKTKIEKYTDVLL